MSLKYRFVKKFRALIGTQEIITALESLDSSLRSTYQTGLPDTSKVPTSGTLQILPGTPYRKYLIPLEYLPSRDYNPRWGYTRPPHSGLEHLFAKNADSYRKRIEELRTLKPFLQIIKKDFTPETAPEPGWIGGPINALDLALLYYFVWKHQPRIYLEVGSGTTTCFARRAISNHKLRTQIVSIDPEPRASINAICDEVIREGLETLRDLSIFEKLEPGDIVFVDGTHRCFMNSDVTVFMLDILPLLRPGVIVHFHDILLPYDYPDSFKSWYWNEQYILGVYLLAARERIQILMPAHFIATAPDLQGCLRPPIVDLDKHNDMFLQGGSLWFTHVGESERV